MKPLNVIISFSLFFTLIKALTNAPDYFYREYYDERTMVICHRGQASYFPENSMPAFTAGAQQKCDFIELDVHLSKDGNFFAMHDPGLNRTTDIKTSTLNTTSMSTLYIDDKKENVTDYFILNYTDTELDQLRLMQSEWTTSSYGTEVPFRNKILDGRFKIPKLEEVLEFCVQYNNKMTAAYGEKHKLVGIYLEIKYPEFYNRFLKEKSIDAGSMTKKLITLLKKYKFDNKTYVEENCPLILESFGEREYWADELLESGMEIPLTQLTDYGEPVDFTEIAKYAHGVGPSSKDLYNYDNVSKDIEVSPFMAQARESGLQVHSYTVRDDHLDYPEIRSPMEEYFRLMVQVNVDGLFCDFGGNALMYAYAFQNFNRTSWDNYRVVDEFIDLTKEVDKRNDVGGVGG